MPVPSTGAASKSAPTPQPADTMNERPLASLMVSDTPSVGEASRLLVAPNEKFFLRHNPRCWEIDVVVGEVEGVKLDGAYWLPEILSFPLVPGANGVRTRMTGEAPELTYHDAQFKAEKLGWVFLSDEEIISARYLPPGVGAGTYRRAVKCQDPRTLILGVHYLEPWRVPVQGIPGDPQKFVWHRESYNLWRASLVITKRIRPPTQPILDDVATRLRARVDRVMILDLPEDVRKRKIAATEAQAERAEKATAPGASA